ncbi:hypothetical protein IFM89_032745 [Coptis chinensis]|uniref:Cupin type-1 domain-containing protein n=1 Tax=Coptis chinensis TaxID=261450 RepID=A0A835HFN9_9MAGN|nr:hypothetical protein IFM89_032745 [Coptis chinensis]
MPTAGEFTDFFLTGTNSIFTGFSTEFVGRVWDLEEDTAKTLVASQTGNGIVKLEEGATLPVPKEVDRDGIVLNCEEAPLDVDVKDGGRVVVLNTQNLPLVGEVGFGADLVRIDRSSMCSPGFSCDSAYQVTYVIRGSGRVQVVGVDGKRVLEITLKPGNLFIVPRFFVVSKIADNDGMEWFSIVTTPKWIYISHIYMEDFIDASDLHRYVSFWRYSGAADLSTREFTFSSTVTDHVQLEYNANCM